jgi:hypothetical protein
MTLKTVDKNSKYANETEIILKSSLEEAKQFLNIIKNQLEKMVFK